MVPRRMRSGERAPAGMGAARASSTETRVGVFDELIGLSSSGSAALALLRDREKEIAPVGGLVLQGPDAVQELGNLEDALRLQREAGLGVGQHLLDEGRVELRVLELQVDPRRLGVVAVDE